MYTWKEEKAVLCEACQTPIPEERWYPKPHCMNCGWILSCCNIEIQPSSHAWKEKEEKEKG